MKPSNPTTVRKVVNMREYKFRAWHKNHKKMITSENRYQDIYLTLDGKPCSEGDYGTRRAPEPYFPWIRSEHIVLMQYTGLKDKNGVEIYEKMEINHRYSVEYASPNYVLKNISNNDIVLFQEVAKNENGLEITKEYTEI